VGGESINFFISHAGADRAWAEWVAWQLEAAGYTVELDVWDWAPGQNFVTAMSDALDRADRVVALLSEAYFERLRWTTEEWSTAVRRLVPVRVEDVPPERIPSVLRPLVFCDVFSVDADQARRVLLAAAKGPQRPDGEPEFPGRGRQGGPGRFGGSGPRLPGSIPRVWNLPARNPGFTGRDGLLVALRQALVSGEQAAVQAVQGMGGVGKTQLAAEYAYRFAGAYELVWWIDADQPALVGDQFAALGRELRCVEPGADVEALRSAVLGELRERGGWLLVFDNAQDSADITGWLPGGGGHVLITSRERKWGEIAAPVEVDVLARPESVALLQSRVAGLGDADADELAGLLGDLPLALAQAGGFMAETGMPVAQYRGLLHARAGQLLAHGEPGSYRASLAAATQLIADRLTGDDPAAAELANLCAFLAPEPIPEDLFTGAASELGGELAARAADPLAWRQTLAHLTRQALARVDQRGLVMHRLTQAILRDRLPPSQSVATRACSEAILAASSPGDPEDPVTWPGWARLMPHLLAADLGATDNLGLRGLACAGNWYQQARGDVRSSHNLAERLYQQWRERLGGDDFSTLSIVHNLASALQDMGRYAEARELDEESLARSRRVLGEDAPDTLRSANMLAIDLSNLGEYQAARELDQDTLARFRRVLGEDHRDTLTSANNLAVDLRYLGEYQAARELDQDTLARSRRVLGEDYPDTLLSASSLADDLRYLGEYQAARELDQDTLARRRRVLGEDHPATLTSASCLADDLRYLGEYQAARELDQDTLTRSRRVLGENHPATLTSANNLADDLRALGETGDEP
jgi:tetratricopeptide (TPR) repeat protein